MSLPADTTIRRMKGNEFALLTKWAAREGWNPGQHDVEAYRAIDPDGFWIALAHDEPAAVISVLTYDPSYAFLGHYIAAPRYRGRGIGKALWDHAIAACPARAIGLDGVIEQQANYARSGFAMRHRNVRYEGVVGQPNALPTELSIRAPASSDRDAIHAFDTRVFGRPRIRFLDRWLAAPGHRARVAERDGMLVGYGAARPCRRGTKVGPLFANDRAVADGLLRALCENMTPPHVLDVPEPNALGTALAAEHDLAATFETARMVRGEAPLDDTTRTFGITTLEAG